MSVPTPAVHEPPVDPVEELDCPHCGGTGVVDDDWEVNGQLVAAEFDCAHCEGFKTCPVDATGRCCCDDCLHLPYDDRLLTEAALTDHERTEGTR